MERTCRGQHGAGEEQGGHEVPVVAVVVAKDGHPTVTGVQRAGQELLQARVRHAGVVAQEVSAGRSQLLSKLALVGQLDGGEDPGADDEVKDVSEDEQGEIQRRLVQLREASAPAS